MDVALLPPPQRLLLELCRRSPVDPFPDAVPPGARPEALLEELTKLAVRHSVQGLVLSRLMTPDGAVEPFGGLEDRIRPGLALVTRQATLWDMEQDRVLTGLDRAHVRPLVLKGGALRRWVFARPVERAMGDL
ncbi:MAG: nucleotidyltransferase family protein, partial [Gemmatimonadota bacterium]